MGHPVSALDPSGDPQEPSRNHRAPVVLVDVAPDDDVHNAGLVLKGQEYHALRGAGPLSQDYQTGDTDPRTFRRQGDLVGP